MDANKLTVVLVKALLEEVKAECYNRSSCDGCIFESRECNEEGLYCQLRDPQKWRFEK